VSASRTGPLATGPNTRPGEKPPTVGGYDRRHDDLGATQFAAYYFKALDWAIATNDDWIVRRISAESCQACRRVSVGLSALRARDTIQLGGRIQLRSAVIERQRYKRHYDRAVRVTYDEQAVWLLHSDGSRRQTQAAVIGDSSIVFLVWQSGRWIVSEVAAP
jgi:hypothetical protein